MSHSPYCLAVFSFALGSGGCGRGMPAEAPVDAQPATSAATPGATGAAATPAAPASKPVPLPLREGVTVTVKNALPSARTSETVAVRLADVQKLLPSLQANQAVVQDQGGTLVLSQLVDSDGDGQLDQLVFQANFEPGQSKTFLVGQAQRSVASHDEYKVYGRFVRERHDDFAWENDRTAHRVYGPELETWAKEPLVSSGIDVWVKRTRRLVINEWYQSDDYHRDNGDGADFYSVGTSRGCGGIGIWDGKQLHVSRNFTHSRVLANGPIRLIFELSYAAWPVGPGVSVAETKRVTVDAGQHFDQFESTFSFKGKTTGLSLGIGIAKHPGGAFEADPANASLRSWEPFSDDNGHLGCAVFAPSATAATFAENSSERLLLVALPSAAPATYLVGTGWDKGGDTADSPAWAALVADRATRARGPLQVSLAAVGALGASVRP